jgi:hypothetical protein
VSSQITQNQLDALAHFSDYTDDKAAISEKTSSD